MTAPQYRRRLGFLHDRRVAKEIAGLDAKADCQRIAMLLSACEFPLDTTRALEVALFHTYGARRVAALLDRTGEFDRRGQRRYDDTRVLIERFVQLGWDDVHGAQALARMNAIHAQYKIRNDDYLFVLWTFIDFPIDWFRSFGWRRMTAHEERAWFNFWVGVGERMGITDIPSAKPDFDAFVEAYEAKEMIPSAAAARVVEATMRIVEGWLPRFLHPLVRPVGRCVQPSSSSSRCFRTARAYALSLVLAGSAQSAGGVQVGDPNRGLQPLSDVSKLSEGPAGQ